MSEYNVDKNKLIPLSIVVAGALIGGGLYFANNSSEPEPPAPAYAPVIPGIVPTAPTETPLQIEPNNEFTCGNSGGVWVPEDESVLYGPGVCVGWED